MKSRNHYPLHDRRVSFPNYKHTNVRMIKDNPIKTLSGCDLLVTNFMRHDVNRLKMSTFVNCAATSGRTHSTYRRQSNNLMTGYSVATDSKEIESSEKKCVIPVLWIVVATGIFTALPMTKSNIKL